MWCGANTPSNYTLFEREDTTGVIPVTTAVLQEDDSTVALTLDEPLNDDVPYVLWADNICYEFYAGSHSEICFGDLPDLAIDELRVDPFESSEGCSSFDFSFGITNEGEERSGDFTASLWLIMDIEGEPDEHLLASYSYDSLGVGEDLDESGAYILSSGMGGHCSVRLVVDDSEQITEIRESNNKKDKDYWSPALRIISITDKEDDHGGVVRIVFNRSHDDRLCDFMHNLETYGIFRRIDESLLPGSSYSGQSGIELYRADPVQRPHKAGNITQSHKEAGSIISGHNDAGNVTPTHADPPGWELVAEIPATGQQEYTALASTLADSTAENGVYWSVYKIRYGPSFSCPDSGYSVVNIPQATLLKSCSASYREHCIEVLWSLSRMDEGMGFNVLRSEDGGYFNRLHEPDIEGRLLSFTFRDSDIACGKSYIYRVEYLVGGVTNLLFETEPVRTPELPLTLYQNYPNPFNPVTTISYYLPVTAHAVLEIYDVSGRKVVCLVDEYKESGRHTVQWSGRDGLGNPVSSGIYFYRLRAGKDIISRKMSLLQ